MSLLRRAPALAIVVAVGCASHAKSLARSATTGVKAEISQIDPVIARGFGEQAGRGAVTGALGELISADNRDLVVAILASTSRAASSGVMAAMSAETGRLQLLFDRAGASAVRSLSRSLESDPAMKEQIGQISHQAAVSAVYGARDALADVFPECTGAADWRHCVESAVGEMSRTAARGMMAGLISGARVPIFAFTFLAGVLITLLAGRLLHPKRVVARTHGPGRRRHQRA